MLAIYKREILIPFLQICRSGSPESVVGTIPQKSTRESSALIHSLPTLTTMRFTSWIFLPSLALSGAAQECSPLHIISSERKFIELMLADWLNLSVTRSGYGRSSAKYQFK